MNDDKTSQRKVLDDAVNDLADYLSVDSFTARKPKHQVVYTRAFVSSGQVELAEELSLEGGYDELQANYELKNLSMPGVHQKFRKTPIKKPTGQPPVIVTVDLGSNWVKNLSTPTLPVAVYHHIKDVTAAYIVNIPPCAMWSEDKEVVEDWHHSERFLLLSLLKNEADFATNFCERTFKRGDSIIAVAPHGIHPISLKLMGWLLTETRRSQTLGGIQYYFYELFGCSFSNLSLFLQILAPTFLMESEDAMKFVQCYIELCQDPIQVEKLALGLKELLRLIIRKDIHNSIDSTVVDELKDIQLHCTSIANLADAYQEFCISSGDMN